MSEQISPGARRAAEALASEEWYGRHTAAAIIERETRVSELVEALQAMHDECSVLRRTGEVLQLGPMMEPSEQSVLRARRLLAEVRKGE